jgi:hypothetical protein
MGEMKNTKEGKEIGIWRERKNESKREEKHV